MKRFKLLNQLLFAAALFVLTATSCKKDNQDTPDDSTSATAILVTEATASSDAVYLVSVAPDGSTKDSITTTELPASVTTYLSTNYSGYTLKKAFKTSLNGAVNGYVVVIMYNGKPVGIRFDASGNFVKVCEQRERGDMRGKGWKEGGRFDGRDGRHRDTVALTSLPTAVTAYLKLTYPTDTLLHAHVDKDGGVVVISANNGLYATAFSSANVFVKRAQIIPNKGRKFAVSAAELPAATTAYLTATYPGYVLDRAFSIKSANAVIAYVVFINSNNTRYALEFSATGSFVKNVVIR